MVLDKSNEKQPRWKSQSFAINNQGDSRGTCVCLAFPTEDRWPDDPVTSTMREQDDTGDGCGVSTLMMSTCFRGRRESRNQPQPRGRGRGSHSRLTWCRWRGRASGGCLSASGNRQPRQHSWRLRRPAECVYDDLRNVSKETSPDRRRTFSPVCEYDFENDLFSSWGRVCCPLPFVVDGRPWRAWSCRRPWQV